MYFISDSVATTKVTEDDTVDAPPMPLSSDLHTDGKFAVHALFYLICKALLRVQTISQRHFEPCVSPLLFTFLIFYRLSMYINVF